ncbi:hypothetical protein RFM41_31280 [Mesorhizobium sp. VK25A]|uniref:Transposase n=2 Tax=Mesorhizobium TaxID=68287 RepID=A0ABU5AE04_9HYPH|nr:MULTISPECIES: hypothetical protein [unclassified Mesorhizobium]MDX8450668.1 hypothetical protein [Mesorhizobium sp. VK3C]MDX8495662.1 hypothetical protein [Mesorhizobium sp. VK22B]MDX8508937.1 hypothetical protein [Mesorhizobium sp. VK22E]MDX8522358.1 hypothetical protein [Mesorhizobium sp. VK23D]MDX8535505.1 hypothetical protein [Mesorhizobium sp. VK25D]
MIGILSIHTTEGLLDIALDAHAAYAILKAIRSNRSKLGLHKRRPGRKPGPGVKRERTREVVPTAPRDWDLSNLIAAAMTCLFTFPLSAQA